MFLWFQAQRPNCFKDLGWKSVAIRAMPGLWLPLGAEGSLVMNQRTGRRKMLWPYGLVENPSEKALRVWAFLSDKERRLISRFNPLKNLRNAALLELKKKGLTQRDLQELSGISFGTIERITVQRKRKDGQRRRLSEQAY